MINKDNSGFCVPYTVRKTIDKGLGVFAEAAIEKDTIIWRYVRGQFAVYDEQSFRQLVANFSRDEVIYLLEHVCAIAEFPDYMIQILDAGALINHSDQANLMTNNSKISNQESDLGISQKANDIEAYLLEDHFAVVAKRYMKEGEEFTMDYNIDPEDPSYYDELCEEYEVNWDWLS